MRRLPVVSVMWLLLAGVVAACAPARIELDPRVVRLPGLAMDIDRTADVAMFARLDVARGTRTLAWLREAGILSRL